ASLPERPLAELLNSDGMMNLNTGYSGTLNPAGWQLSGGLDGSPRFVPTAPGDENWDDRFNPPGTNGQVLAMAVSGSTLYIGGNFTGVGNVAANYIAAWNGSTWSPLGSGLDGDVEALVVSGSTLYAGGAFNSAGGVAANRMAAWNISTSTWSALGGGVAGYVTSLAMGGGGTTLYVGGTFFTAGGVTANRI